MPATLIFKGGPGIQTMKPLPAFHFAIGLWLAILAMWAAVRPYSLLDVVLTQEELRNREVADATLTLMQKGAGSDAGWMAIIGIVLMVTSLIANRIGKT
jgi:hypothetical protein